MRRDRRAPGTAAHSIVSSRLLVLQSKRLVLNSTERHSKDVPGRQAITDRIEKLRRDTEAATEAYQRTMLEWGSPDQHDFWVVAYSRLIGKGHFLSDKLREAHATLPPAERYEVSAEVEVIEGMIARWTDSMRRSMVGAAASA